MEYPVHDAFYKDGEIIIFWLPKYKITKLKVLNIGTVQPVMMWYTISNGFLLLK